MVLILPDNFISFVVCEEHTNTEEEVCSTESLHNQFIVRPRDTHKNLKIQTKGAGSFGRLYFLANSGAEYKPAHKTGLQRRKYGGNMEILHRENLLVTTGKEGFKTVY